MCSQGSINLTNGVNIVREDQSPPPQFYEVDKFFNFSSEHLQSTGSTLGGGGGMLIEEPFGDFDSSHNRNGTFEEFAVSESGIFPGFEPQGRNHFEEDDSTSPALTVNESAISEVRIKQNILRNAPGLILRRASSTLLSSLKLESGKTSRKKAVSLAHLRHAQDLLTSPEFAKYDRRILFEDLMTFKQVFQKASNTYESIRKVVDALNIFDFTFEEEESPKCANLLIKTALSLLTDEVKQDFDYWIHTGKMKTKFKESLKTEKKGLREIFFREFRKYTF